MTKSQSIRVHCLPVLLALHAGPLLADHLSYDNDIYPLLEDRCLACHHNPGAPNGLSMETYPLMMKGSQNGAVVIAGNAAGSEVIKRITGQRHPKMPMNGPPYLSELEIELVSSWIDAGAREH